MLPRLLMVVGLTVGVMLPLVWVAFAPGPDLRQVSKPEVGPHEKGSSKVERRAAPTRDAEKPLNPTAQSSETTIGTAPYSEAETSAARSDDLPRAGVPETSPIEPDLPQISDRQAAPKPAPIEPDLSQAYDKEAAAKPTLIEPKLPQTTDKEATPEPALTEPDPLQATGKEAAANLSLIEPRLPPPTG